VCVHAPPPLPRSTSGMKSLFIYLGEELFLIVNCI
jgi:hypothetical protein